MAALVTDAGLDLAAFRAHLVDRLPGYAHPVFLRLCSELDVTATFKHTKSDFVRQGYDPAASADVIYFNDPDRRAFVRLDAALYERIQAGQIRCDRHRPPRKVGHMRSETIAIHSGYEVDPTTKAVAVPIYQTVAYAFDSGRSWSRPVQSRGRRLRYSRISNPTTAVWSGAWPPLEGGVDALCVSSGQAALNYAVLNVTGLGTNIVSVPQLYGTTYTLFAHLLPSQGITVRFAESDQPAAIEALIDDDTRAVFCESVGNPAATSATSRRSLAWPTDTACR